QALGEASADDDQFRARRYRPNPAQIRGEYLAQLLAAARVAVAEDRRWRGAADLPHRPGPVGARKARQIGHAGGEIDREARSARAVVIGRGGGAGWDAAELSSWLPASPGSYPGR